MESEAQMATRGRPLARNDFHETAPVGHLRLPNRFGADEHREPCRLFLLVPRHVSHRPEPTLL